MAEKSIFDESLSFDDTSSEKKPRKIKMQMEIVEGKGRMIVDFDGPPAAMYCCCCCCFEIDVASA